MSIFLLLGVILSSTRQMSMVASFSIGVEVPATRRASPGCRLFAQEKESSYSSSSLEQHDDVGTNQKTKLVHDFVHHVQQSVQEKTFVSLILQGTAPKKKKKKGQLSMLEDPFLGSIRQVQGRLIQLTKNKKEQVSLQLTIKYHGATDICKNMAPDEISTKLAHLLLEPLASEWGVQAVQVRPFQGAELKTLQDLWELEALHPGNKATLRQKKIMAPSTNGGSIVQAASHDRTKQVPLAQTTADTTFLQALGLSKPDGSPRPGMSSKLRQCNKFVEIVSGLIGKTTAASTKESRLRVVDMGCGRAYLTFSLHSFLCEEYPNVLGVGVDVRPKLVAEIDSIARSLGGPFDTLSFQTGTIEEIVAGTTSIFGGSNNSDGDDSKEKSENDLDVLIALHACDTATDDALFSGISQGADVIVVAPCCHKEVRSQVNTHVAATKEDHPLYDVLKHGVYRERISETVTDSLRALLLEQAGYKVQVFEFIGGEHTSKNVMITAIRPQKSGPNDDSATENTDRIQELASFHGVTYQRLAHWMGLDLGGETTSKSVQPGRTQLKTTQMPPRVR
jgi:hypothetical protein